MLTPLSCLPPRPESVPLQQATEVLFAEEPFQKKGHDYRIADFTVSPRGEAFVAYREPGWPLKKSSYLAHHRRDGSIQWEVPLPGLTLEKVTLTGQGAIAWGREGFQVLGVDGGLAARVEFEAEAKAFWVDSTGHVFVALGDDRRLVGYDGQGRELDLPALQARQAQVLPQGLLVRDRDRAVLLGPGSATPYQLPSKEGSKKVHYVVGDAHLPSDGLPVWEVVKNVEIRNVRPGPGIGLGWGPQVIDQFGPEYASRTSFIKTDPTGTVLWETEEISTDTKFCPSGDQIFALGGLDRDQTTPVKRIGADGRVEEPFRVAGAARAIHVLEEGLLIEHQGGFSLFNPDGRQLRRLSPPKHSFTFQGRSQDQLYFSSYFQRELYRYDLGTGQWRQLTDADKSHPRLALDAIKPQTSPGEVEWTPDYVEIDGYQLPVEGP